MYTVYVQYRTIPVRGTRTRMTRWRRSRMLPAHLVFCLLECSAKAHEILSLWKAWVSYLVSHCVVMMCVTHTTTTQWLSKHATHAAFHRHNISRNLPAKIPVHEGLAIVWVSVWLQATVNMHIFSLTLLNDMRAEFPVVSTRECFVSQWNHFIALLRYLPLFLPSDLSPADHQSCQPTPLSFAMLVGFLCTSCDAWGGLVCCAHFFSARCYLNSTGSWYCPFSLYADTRM
jgi:hypothetical protein